MVLYISSAVANVRKTRLDSEGFQEKLNGLKNETEKFCNAETRCSQKKTQWRGSGQV
jgi:hypothetical protein